VTPAWTISVWTSPKPASTRLARSRRQASRQLPQHPGRLRATRGPGLPATADLPPSACTPVWKATGNWGLDLAAFLHAPAYKVSIVNPRQIKAFGDSELARNKTDKARCRPDRPGSDRAHQPPPWTPPAAGCASCASWCAAAPPSRPTRTQEIQSAEGRPGLGHRCRPRSSGCWPISDQEIHAITAAIRDLIARDPAQQQNFELLCSIPSIGEVTAALVLAELPTHCRVHAQRPRPPSPGYRRRKTVSGARRSFGWHQPDRANASLRSALFLCALTLDAQSTTGRLRQTHDRGCKPNKVHPDRARPQAAGDGSRGHSDPRHRSMQMPTQIHQPPRQLGTPSALWVSGPTSDRKSLASAGHLSTRSGTEYCDIRA